MPRQKTPRRSVGGIKGPTRYLKPSQRVAQAERKHRFRPGNK